MHINRLTLSFEAGQEKKYREDFFRSSLPVVRIALLLTGMLYGAFGYLDYILDVENLGLFHFIRFGIVIPLMILVVVMSYFPFVNRIWQEFVAMLAVVGGVGLVVMIVTDPGNNFDFGGLMLVFSAIYFFIKLRFVVATISAWIIVVVFNIMAVWLGKMEPIQLITYNFFYIAANFIGMLAAYYLEVSDRKNFFLKNELAHSKEQLENINQNLEGMVKERTQDLIESEDRFRNLSDLLPLIVYEIDTHGILTYANQEAIRSIGVDKIELYKGTSLLRFVAPEDRPEAMRSLQKSMKNAGTTRTELTAMRKNGDKFPVMVYSGQILRNDKVVGVRSVVVDLSEQKANEKLRTEIAVTRQSAEFKQNFLANMSHEIRTPLTGIIGITEILSGTELTNQQREHISTLKISTENLREIINQILDYSKIEAGKILLKPETFHTSTVFDNALKFFNYINHKPVQLQMDIHENLPPYLQSDIQRIQQIITNLLSNALKFTTKGLITLRARVQKWNDDHELLVRIEVEDTGIGIEPEKQKLLFKPFSQVDHRDTRNFEGTGLGLSICRDLSRLLNGDIGVESTAGKGSLFWFTFQASISEKSQVVKTSKKTDVTREAKSLRILLVEDKLVNQKVIGLMLTSRGHVVTNASNGEKAIEIYQPDLFDIVLMDIQMPVMDGVSATRQLRKLYGERPFIVGLSANAFEGDREKYMASGMDDYLTKPVRGEDFQSLIANWFKNN